MSIIIVDMLPLQPGRSVEEAIAYFEELKPIFEKHGLKRLDAPLKVMQIMRGESPAQLINLFETDDPQVSMKGLSEDPAYQAKIPTRDEIFDLSKATIAATTRL